MSFDGRLGSCFTGSAGVSCTAGAIPGAGVAGVCSGLAWYFNIDVTIIRIIMLVALIAGTSGFWIYLVLWIAIPKALTPAQQCEMRGIPATAENMARCKNYAQETNNR